MRLSQPISALESSKMHVVDDDDDDDDDDRLSLCWPLPPQSLAKKRPGILTE